MSKENIQTKLICLKDSGLSLDECQFTGRLEFHDTHSIASLVSNTTCAEIRATEIFLNFDKEIDAVWYVHFSVFIASMTDWTVNKRFPVFCIQYSVNIFVILICLRYCDFFEGGTSSLRIIEKNQKERNIKKCQKKISRQSLSV